MNYIILAAGKGTRLYPYTVNLPKSLLKLNNKQTILQRTINIIRESDKTAKIYTVVGFKINEFISTTKGCDFIENPFYKITNSIASLWFAKEFLNDETVVLNSDIVFNKQLLRIILNCPKKAFVAIDTSIKQDGDYNAQINNDQIVIMGKDLKEYHGEYAGITKLDKHTAKILKNEIISMVNDGLYNEWYENALVQLIINFKIKLEYIDIKDFEWAEIDTINSFLKARSIKGYM
ncbi:MAG: phosphocholine cytidylyltransferase family protein [Endomicrobium sp.]|jgi:choline kinase|uniref:phosphocholine cytidylyltransferase family protein n=1 Tax=Candidatus Endomicrobiellum cubanum TaxID=3242325 RepID=UPI00281DE068|nr:phosphocholine cytidylyltransferase family protein [Endomicrobium sp.]